MVIEKPCGIPSQMGTGMDAQRNPSVDILASTYLRAKDEDAFLVHRLDRSTSGLMCIAKSRDMAAYLSTQMMERKIKKEYTALICNFTEFFPFPKHGVIR